MATSSVSALINVMLRSPIDLLQVSLFRYEPRVEPLATWTLSLETTLQPTSCALAHECMDMAAAQAITSNFGNIPPNIITALDSLFIQPN
jgi:hypothetical protein